MRVALHGNTETSGKTEIGEFQLTTLREEDGDVVKKQKEEYEVSDGTLFDDDEEKHKGKKKEEEQTRLMRRFWGFRSRWSTLRA